MTEHFYAQAGNVVLIIETDSTSTAVFLYTFFPDGFIGDNWFSDIDDAKAQAAHNASGFPGAIGLWKSIPPEVSDLMEFGKGLLKNSN
ncbi:MAG: hypothetical protein ABSC92_16700 [Rhizomicrobium sp.]|jgi:hypothetical protein